MPRKGEMSEKFYKVVEDFRVNRSYAKTGRLNGLSRQRVERIIKDSGIDVKPLLRKGAWIGQPCKYCNIVLKPTDKHKGSYHFNCYAKSKYKVKRIKEVKS